jgi:hypothetical protein
VAIQAIEFLAKAMNDGALNPQAKTSGNSGNEV